MKSPCPQFIENTGQFCGCVSGTISATGLSRRREQLSSATTQFCGLPSFSRRPCDEHACFLQKDALNNQHTGRTGCPSTWLDDNLHVAPEQYDEPHEPIEREPRELSTD